MRVGNYKTDNEVGTQQDTVTVMKHENGELQKLKKPQDNDEDS
jgi:hypothetical protein